MAIIPHYRIRIGNPIGLGNVDLNFTITSYNHRGQSFPKKSSCGMTKFDVNQALSLTTN